MATIKEIRDEYLDVLKKQSKYYAHKIINTFDIEMYIEEDDEDYTFNYNAFIDDLSKCDKIYIDFLSGYVENLKHCIHEIKRVEDI